MLGKLLAGRVARGLLAAHGRRLHFMIKYIGSKRKLVPHIQRLAKALPNVTTALDLFSGTSRVGHALKAEGLTVTANDHNSYAFQLARCYVQADANKWMAPAQALIEELNRVPGRPGYFTKTFCEDARYFQPKNGARVDAIRDCIAHKGLPPELESIALVSLMEAADRVDSTVGVQMAYLKQWAKRAHNDLSMRVPNLLAGTGRALQMDAFDAVSEGGFDLAYLDPPYNQHKYRNNYHVWETLVRWDAPETYGVACKRTDCREYQSDFNSKKKIAPALSDIIERVDARFLVISFSNEGYIEAEQICDLLAPSAEVRVLSVDHARYVGAKIGIYSPEGKKTGKVSHLRNQELFFVADRSRSGVLSKLPDLQDAAGVS